MAEIKSNPLNACTSDDGKASFWAIADPVTAANAARAVYGSHAATAAAHCALTAHFDGRNGDYRFWCRVFHELGDGQGQFPGSVAAL
ncbi:hypothetical protein RFM99_29170 [Mesorhizobium sp. VK4C]|uniref:hypothetical protein n=1 Tax=Mesorhizobium captivum TaxID=3072319 RepID=UPI002A23FA2C|nr:hypothetical protein [Mesorhizobium sp. VK4C]MDX8502458.1 hypothetical protein [Mesorhizobium sp. VK4C]